MGSTREGYLTFNLHVTVVGRRGVTVDGVYDVMSRGVNGNVWLNDCLAVIEACHGRVIEKSS